MPNFIGRCRDLASAWHDVDVEQLLLWLPSSQNPKTWRRSEPVSFQERPNSTNEESILDIYELSGYHISGIVSLGVNCVCSLPGSFGRRDD